jgi:diguanylate cyclase (GGDEF)-like protein
MFLDLDRFKVVNDSLGHIAGNAMLRVVARRLAESVQPGDVVARLGGDEFAVLLQSIDDPEAAVALAHHLLNTLAAPIQINGTEVVPGASIGVTFSDLGERSTDEVLRDADLAMYEAKATGRNRVTVFDAGMHERIAEKMQLESDLRRAIAEGQLTLVFQPMYELEPYRLVGFEALARWSHPLRGPISPLVFIALAEENGHIEALTAWVIERAAAQLAQWHAIGPHLVHLGVHVNISGRDLAHAYLVPHVRDVLARFALPARALTLEITETTLMGRLDIALGALQRMRELGVCFSIDDFGTGYSSLAYLSTLPIDHLKIDRSFVSGMDRSPDNVEIVRAMLTLGNTLKKTVVAEGIETPEQLATLRALGVHVGQGYLLSRPLRVEQVDALLHEDERRAA